MSCVRRSARTLLPTVLSFPILLPILLGVPSVAVAADGTQLAITETRTPMSRGIQPALTVVIPKGSAKVSEKAWKDQLGKFRAKVKVEKGEIFADNASLPQISENTVDIFTRFTDTKEGVAMAVTFDLGGAFLSSATHADPYKAAENLVYLFAVDQAKAAVGQEIDDAEKVHKKLQEEKKKLERDQKGYEREIEKHKEHIKALEEQIKEAEGLILENQKAQGAKQAEADRQAQTVEALKVIQQAIR